jgi:hypothetical protein
MATIEMKLPSRNYRLSTADCQPSLFMTACILCHDFTAILQILVGRQNFPLTEIRFTFKAALPYNISMEKRHPFGALRFLFICSGGNQSRGPGFGGIAEALASSR